MPSRMGTTTSRRVKRGFAFGAGAGGSCGNAQTEKTRIRKVRRTVRRMAPPKRNKVRAAWGFTQAGVYSGREVRSKKMERGQEASGGSGWMVTREICGKR